MGSSSKWPYVGSCRVRVGFDIGTIREKLPRGGFYSCRFRQSEVDAGADIADQAVHRRSFRPEQGSKGCRGRGGERDEDKAKTKTLKYAGPDQQRYRNVGGAVAHDEEQCHHQAQAKENEGACISE